MAKLQKKNMSAPDETRNIAKGKIDFVKLEGFTFGLMTFEPGWKWSESIKPMANTDSCQVTHLGYQISGKLHVAMDDGTQEDFGPGDICLIPAGHNAWVVGEEQVVILDVTGLTDYAMV